MDVLKKFITKYKAGTIVYQKGDVQTDFFIINKGKIQLKNDENGQILTTLGKGDFFGEESLNNEQSAIYTVEVIEDADMIKIPYISLTEMLKQMPDIALKVLKKLSEKHIKIQSVLMSMAVSSPPGQGKTGGQGSKKRRPDIGKNQPGHQGLPDHPTFEPHRATDENPNGPGPTGLYHRVRSGHRSDR